MLATVHSATVDGVEGRPVRVEVHVSNGLPAFTIVGQPDGACRESRDRVRAALLSSGFPWPLRRVTVNLAPSALRKVGAGFDLPIAVGLLVATGGLPASAVDGCVFIGELGLDGSLRRVPGIIAMVSRTGGATVVVPASAAGEAGLGGLCVRGAVSLRQVVHALKQEEPWSPVPGPTRDVGEEPAQVDMAEVRGQMHGVWAVRVAAAGGHHLLMMGAPGGGKTMLAERLPGLLPPLDDGQALETTRVWSVAGMLPERSGLIRRPPFRSPHHSASMAALLGGGTSRLRPGEISLAHNGVLFLDELSEFPRSVVDGLRQPLEAGWIRVCRANAVANFPARFQLVGAANPCPCGYGLLARKCLCSEAARNRYATRLSGPLLDRFDLRVLIPRTDVAELLGLEPTAPSAVLAEEVSRVRRLARERGVSSNSAIPADRLDELAPLTPRAAALLRRRLEMGRLNPRGLHRVRRVARTVADVLGQVELIDDVHVADALELRVDEDCLRPGPRRGGR